MARKRFVQPENAILNRLDNISEWVLEIIWAVAALVAVIALGAGVLTWLAEGTFPDYDLFFLLADVQCAATGGVPKGFDGMLLCREAFPITDLVGLNKILSFLFDIHLSLSVLLGAFALSIVWLFLFSLVRSSVAR